MLVLLVRYGCCAETVARQPSTRRSDQAFHAHHRRSGISCCTVRDRCLAKLAVMKDRDSIVAYLAGLGVGAKVETWVANTMAYVDRVEAILEEQHEEPDLSRLTATDPLRLSRDRDVLADVEVMTMDGVAALVEAVESHRIRSFVEVFESAGIPVDPDDVAIDDDEWVAEELLALLGAERLSGRLVTSGHRAGHTHREEGS